MAQPNVAREPSMEEILASIRRIIESNEPTTDGAPSRPMSPAYAEDEIEDIDDDMSFVPDMAANDPGLPAQANPSMTYLNDTPAVSPVGERALSLADVAARVRAASVRQQETASVRPVNFPSPAMPTARQPEAQPVPVPAPAMPVSLAAELRPAFQPTASVESIRPEFRAFAAVEDMPRVQETPRVQDMPAVQEPTVRQEAQPATVEENLSLPAKIEETANLLSAEAGAQVAKSFNELAAVFNGLEHRSVEDMAQEMLRPMLQEWLDDNLPTLVERLVREEIERVARGPRR